MILMGVGSKIVKPKAAIPATSAMTVSTLCPIEAMSALTASMTVFK